MDVNLQGVVMAHGSSTWTTYPWNDSVRDQRLKALIYAFRNRPGKGGTARNLYDINVPIRRMLAYQGTVRGWLISPPLVRVFMFDSKGEVYI